MKKPALTTLTSSYTVSVVLLALTVILLLLSLQFYQQQQQSQTAAVTAALQQQRFAAIEASLRNAVSHQQTRLATLAESLQLANLLSRTDEKNILDWQNNIKQLLPEVEHFCVLLSLPDKPGNNGCLDISYLTLDSLRQLEDKPQSDIAMVQPGSDEAHILLAQKLKSTDSSVKALVMTVKASWLDQQIDDSLVASGYLEISQGQKAATKLSGYGNPQFKQGKPLFLAEIPNTHWTLQYWPEQRSTAAGFMLPAFVMTFILIILWWFRDFYHQRLLRQDSDTLRQQLDDLQHSSLKPEYRLRVTALEPVSLDISHLVVPKKGIQPKPPKPKAPVDEAIEEEILLSSEPEIIVEHALAQASKVQLSQAKEQEKNVPTLPDKAIFRHYDVRGKVDSQLTPAVMEQLGQAVASEALEQSQTRLVLGRDGRLSSDSLAQAFIKGVLSTGCDLIDVGQVPTPMVYFACEHLETHTGAMITGSHNPTDFNGLKIVIGGKTLLGEGVSKLYDRIKEKRLKQGQGQLSRENIKQAYIDRIAGEIKLSRPMRIVIDCGNGVAGNVAADLFDALGCHVTELFCEVDGRFPHHHPDPGQPENLQDLIKTVKEQEAELGLAYDGDGDRLGVVDGDGNIIWPDRLLLLMAQYMLVDQPGATILFDVKSTSMLEEVISRAGGNPIMTPSGHSVIKSLMVEHNAMLAGEMTGHFFFRDRWYGFDDALYSAARLLELLAADPLERTPTEVFAALPSRVSTPEIIVEMAEGESHRFIEQLQANVEFAGGKLSTVDGIRVDYPQGWGLVRASNTVPGLTLRFEATSKEELEYIKQAFIQQMLQIKPTLSLLF
ncbi:phosphomannomutase/phosphoglucomutase [Methylophaga sp.]|uniref:phosphomannomutase/phosphoglucomutase n=1 Tax=Methylophaga sp. TaxID=2024840 RepID=UPI0013FEE227|nr:phosphomannomutase/phosphoglucomutase [Methylophaga sp.]MTI63721.1 phosphomannomutase/phosphoglucomutase [Methylophaga sp.]